MYKYKQPQKTSLKVNNSYPAERHEQRIRRVLNNKEPIKDGAPLIYTERKDGVRAELDIRTDKWEIAAEAMDKVNRERLAKSTGSPVTTTTDSAKSATVEQKNMTEGQSAEGTSQSSSEPK